MRALRHILFVVLFPLMALAACDARAEHTKLGGFDGKWEFDMSFTGDAMCNFEGLPLVTMMRDGHADGLYSEPNYGGWTYSAVVQESGAFEMVMGGYAILRLTGKLLGDSGKGGITVSGTSLLCRGTWMARKLSQATQLRSHAA